MQLQDLQEYSRPTGASHGFEITGWVIQSMQLNAQQLAELIAAHAGPLRVWVRSRCAECEDVVQDAFCKLAAQDPSPDHPVAWLYRVCRNLAEKQRSSDSRRRKREHLWAQNNRLKPAGDDETDLVDTLAAVDLLDNELREVLVARIWGRLSFEEVAELCDISASTAFRRYEAALQSIRATLNPQREERP